MKKFMYAMMVCAVAFANVACDEDNDGLDDNINNGGEVVEPKVIGYSFTQKAYVMSESTELTVELRDREGLALVADKDIPCSIWVDESSTAKEGVNFEIESKDAVVARGSNKCTFKLRSIAQSETAKKAATDEETPVVAGDKIVLNLEVGGIMTPADSAAYSYYAGAFPQVTITLVGGMVSDLYGTWVMNELVTDKEALDGTWGGMVTFDGLPQFNAADKFIFEDGVLTTELSSEWANYFNPKSTFRMAGELTGKQGLHTLGGGMTTIDVQLLEVYGVNRYFSATEFSRDTTAYLAVRNIEGPNGEPLLDVYVIDYESKSFAPEFLDFFMYKDEKPVATDSGVHLNFTLKKEE